MLTQATPEAAGRAWTTLQDQNADLGQKVQAVGDTVVPAGLGLLTTAHGFHEPTVGPSGLTGRDIPGMNLADLEHNLGKQDSSVVVPPERQLPFKRFSVDETGQVADMASLGPEDRATWMKGPVEDQAQTPSTEAQTSQAEPGLSDQEIGLQESQISAPQSSGKADLRDLNSIGGSIEPEAAKAAHIEDSQDAVGQSPVKQLAPDLRVSVQSPQEMTHFQTGEKSTVPGYVQIDEVKDGKNTWSKGPESLKAEGYNVPDYSKLPQGKYTVNEANEMLKRGKATKLYSGVPLLDPDYVNEVLVPKARLLLRNTKELGLQIGQAGIDGAQLVARLMNKVPDKEKQMLEEQGIREAFPPGKKVTADVVDKWVKDNGPKVEVKVFKSGDSKVKEAPDLTQMRAELATLEHQLDTRDSGWRDKNVNEINQDFRPLYERHQELVGQFDAYADKADQAKNTFDPDTYRSIAPKDADQTVVMVRVPTKDRLEGGVNYGDNKSILHQGHHFGNEDKNVLGWARVQYEDTPKGKVAHVIEVQSDWGQRVREESKDPNRQPGSI
jgi:ribosomal protein S7